MLDRAGSTPAPAARCKSRRRRNFKAASHPTLDHEVSRLTEAFHPGSERFGDPAHLDSLDRGIFGPTLQTKVGESPRHAPVDRLDGAPLDGAASEIFCGELLCVR